ncbi:MAG: hypothetical protein IJE14_05870 [Clostridia bacterium]|nr:hypothetical protein [Clostridia bacterium]
MKNINKENIQVSYRTLNKTSFTYSVMKSAEETLKGQPREVEAELGKALDTLLDDKLRFIELKIKTENTDTLDIVDEFFLKNTETVFKFGAYNGDDNELTVYLCF